MKKAFLNQVRLDPELVRDRDAMSEYMRRNLDLPCWFGGNLDALADVVPHLLAHLLFRRNGDQGEKGKNSKHANQDDDFSEATVVELLCHVFFLVVSSSVWLIHDE